MSGLPQIGAWGSELGAAFANVGQGLSNIINPHQEIEKELQKRIAANPKIIQELYDQELDNPGSVSATFGPRVAKWVKDRSGSLTRTVEQRAKAKIAEDPTLLDDAATRAVVGMTGAGRTTEKNQAKITTDQATVSTLTTADAPAALAAEQKQREVNLKFLEDNAQAEHDTKAAQARASKVQADLALRRWQAIQDQVKDPVTGKPIDIQNIARLSAHNKNMTDDEKRQFQTAMTADPEVLQQLIASIKDDDSRKYAWADLEYRRSKEGRENKSAMITLWTKLKNPGTISDLEKYTYDPATNQKAAQIYQAVQAGADPNSLSTQDAALYNIHRAVLNSEGTANALENIKYSSAIGGAIVKYKQAKKDGDSDIMDATANELSGLYTYKLQRETGKPFEVMVTQGKDDKWFNRDSHNLLFTVKDPSGTTVTMTEEEYNAEYGASVKPERASGRPGTTAKVPTTTGSAAAPVDDGNRISLKSSSEESGSNLNESQNALIDQIAALDSLGARQAYVMQIQEPATQRIIIEGLRKRGKWITGSGQRVVDSIGLRPK